MLGVPAGVRRLRDPGGPVAVPHLGADRPRGRADRGFDAAGRRGDEARRVWRLARGDDAFPARAWQCAGSDAIGWLLAVIGIVYGAMVALVQKDFKFVIGYSSVSHMGFVLLGLMTLNPIGLSGAVLQMFSHGIIAGLLFAVVGRMVYDRTHTRDLAALEGMELSRALPFAAGTFVMAGMASMGLPGFSGFVAELQVLIGAWQAFPPVARSGGRRDFGGRGLHVARAAKGVFWRGRRAAEAENTNPTVASAARRSPLPETHRRGDPDWRHAADRLVSAAAARRDCAEF